VSKRVRSLDDTHPSSYRSRVEKVLASVQSQMQDPSSSFSVHLPPMQAAQQHQHPYSSLPRNPSPLFPLSSFTLPPAHLPDFRETVVLPPMDSTKEE
jgi:hypothetical protein